MTTDTITCAEFDEAVAELALELVDARQRDALMLHAAACDRCRVQLDDLATVADRLALLAPRAEPPVGFEQRAVQRMRGPLRRWRPLVLAAAAIALLVGGAAAGYAVTRSTSTSEAVRYGPLVNDAGQQRGWVSIAGTEHPVVTMTLQNVAAGTYSCLVRSADGATRELASWPIAASGFGTWAIPLGDRSQSVVAIVVRDANGATVASADLSAD